MSLSSVNFAFQTQGLATALLFLLFPSLFPLSHLKPLSPSSTRCFSPSLTPVFLLLEHNCHSKSSFRTPGFEHNIAKLSSFTQHLQGACIFTERGFIWLKTSQCRCLSNLMHFVSHCTSKEFYKSKSSSRQIDTPEGSILMQHLTVCCSAQVVTPL